MKKFWSVIAAGALISSVFTVGSAQAAPEVPATPNIVDPKGDANYLNDQGLAGAGLTGTPAVVPAQGDNVTPADGGSVSDILAIWFSADADNVYTHIQTEAPGPAAAALFYRVTVDPGVGANCLWFQGSAAGAGNAGTPGASLRVISPCEPTGTVTEGAEFIQEAGPDGTGLHTIKIPRALSPYLAEGNTLFTPRGQSRHNTQSNTPAGGAVAPQIDNTKAGLEYVIAAGGGGTAGPPVAEEPKEEKPEKDPKGCKKGKGKKKGCGKDKGKGPKGPKAGCDTLKTGTLGAEATTLTVTDAATAEAPVDLPVKLDMSLADLDLGSVLPAPFDPTQQLLNIQVDSAAADAGLYLSFSFPQRRDYDMFLRHSDDSEAASSHGFNTAIETPFNNTKTNHAGQSTASSESIVGLRTSDCGGYTLEVNNWLGEGGNMVVKAWLGESVNDPRPIGEVPFKK